jgi:hypothetical protein
VVACPRVGLAYHVLYKGCVVIQLHLTILRNTIHFQFKGCSVISLLHHVQVNQRNMKSVFTVHVVFNNFCWKWNGHPFLPGYPIYYLFGYLILQVPENPIRSIRRGWNRWIIVIKLIITVHKTYCPTGCTAVRLTKLMRALNFIADSSTSNSWSLCWYLETVCWSRKIRCRS